METLATGYAFLEAPRDDGAGGLYFVDEKAVYHVDEDGHVEVLDPNRLAGGILLHESGGIVVSGEHVVHLRPDGSTRTILVLPAVDWINDIYADAQGRVLCGAIPALTEPGEGEPPPGHLWRIDGPGTATQLYKDVGFSNGIAFSPDGRTLYHCDTVRREIIVHEIEGDQVGGRSTLSTAPVSGGPDGMAVDCAGYLWVAMYGGGCVARFAPDGTLERVLELPAVNVTSVAFGGADCELLYIVTCDNTDAPELRGCIYRLEAPVAGLPTPTATI